MNYLKTGLLLIVMTALFLGIGYALGGRQGMSIAFIMALAMNFGSYWFSDKIVLSMHGARAVTEDEAPEFVGLVRELAQQAGLPMPKTYIMQNDQPNAFATGRSPSNAAVATTTGLLRILNREELAGVMAHELAHVKNRDTLIMTLTAALAGAIGYLSHFAMFFGGRREDGSRSNPLVMIAVMILAPLAAMLVQMAISRSREYGADHGGAEISGNPMALASALRKIEHYARGTPNIPAEENPATAHMFIINPLTNGGMDNLFSTHPNTENRILELEALAARMGTQRPALTQDGPWPKQVSGPWG